MLSGDMGTVPRAVLAGWVSAVAARFARPARLKNTSRAEFEQVARDLELSSPQLYGLLTGCALAAEVVEKRLSDMEIATKRTGAPRASEARLTAEMQEFLMFGPFCC